MPRNLPPINAYLLRSAEPTPGSYSWADARSEATMALEAIQAEISLLLNQMENQPEDRHELHLVLLERIGELRAFGLPVPQDLVELEAALAAEFPQRPVPETSG